MLISRSITNDKLPYNDMESFISDLIPKIQRYSQQLDNLTLLTKQHWVVVDDKTDTKHVYIFRSNNDLLIAQNGRVEKARWEYLGNNALLIDKKDECLLFRHGFFDENILILQIDGREEYIFLVTETKYSGKLFSLERIREFLNNNYYSLPMLVDVQEDYSSLDLFPDTYQVIEGKFEIIGKGSQYMALLNDRPAPDGKYKIDDMWYLHVKNGIVFKESDC